MLFEHPADVVAATRLDDVRRTIREVETRCRDSGLYASGFVCYEAAAGFDSSLATHEPGLLPLAMFGLFDRYTAIPAPSFELTDQPVWVSDIQEDGYRRTIERIRRLIAEGETYQVNHTIRLHAQCSPSALNHLLSNHNGGYGALIDCDDWTIVCGSPELFFERNGREIISKPMKGTRPRGLMLADDEALHKDLSNSEKDRAENLMIVDMIRNDMGKIAIPGSVAVDRLFEAEKYLTVHQMTSTVRCQTDANLADIFGALFPPASITGAPKRHTMEIIRDLEKSPREIYTGTIGFVRPDGSAQFNVAIRTATIKKTTGQAVYGVGGGIVWDSDPAKEWEECWHKAAALRNPTPEFDLFETLKWTPSEGFWLLDRHLSRLAESAQYFGLGFDHVAAVHALEHHARSLEVSARVRLQLSGAGEITIQSGPMPEPSAKKPFVGISKVHVSSADRFLYHKTSRRDIYRKALESCPGCDDAILVNERGELTESTIANLAVRIGNRLFTPPVTCGLLPGTLRAEMHESKELIERVLLADELHRFEDVFLLNSVRGMYQVEVRSGQTEPET